MMSHKTIAVLIRTDSIEDISSLMDHLRGSGARLEIFALGQDSDDSFPAEIRSESELQNPEIKWYTDDGKISDKKGFLGLTGSEIAERLGRADLVMPLLNKR